MDNTAFCNYVGKYFDYLLDRYGFRKTLSRECAVTYESESLDVIISYDKSNCDYSVVVRSRSEPNFQMDLRVICDALGTDFRAELPGVVSSENVHKFVPKSAQIIEALLRNVLAGDEQDFIRLKRRFKSYIEETSRREVTDQILREAEVQWRKRNYSRVRDLLVPIESRLSDSWVAKLRYAQKKL